MSRLRQRVTYANVTATLALVFAMTGGAYAASKILITSTKQIKPSVLAQLKGKAGAAGAQGLAGPAGPAGLQGPVGAKGENGTPGANGTSGKDGESVTSAPLSAGSECAEGGSKFTVGGKTTTACNGGQGEPGPQGPPGTTGFTRTLPKGETETGAWVVKEAITEKHMFWDVPISFSIPLKTGISFGNVHVVNNCEFLSGESKSGCEAEVKEAEIFCPGKAAEPKADEGDLCIYQGATSSPSETKTEVLERFAPASTLNPAIGGGGTAARTGAVLVVSYAGPVETEEKEKVSGFTAGTWAVTPES